MYQLNDEKMFYDMAEGQAIVIDFTTGIYYGTNALGSVVLDRVLAGNKKEMIVKALQELPDCPSNIEELVDTFIADLQGNEIIVAGPTNEGGAEPIDTLALEDGFELTVEAYSEVQDLILADPVHDVDEEQGWPVMKEE